jgi:hypothetical protein
MEPPEPLLESILNLPDDPGLPFASALDAALIQRIFQEEQALFGQEDLFSTQIALWGFLAQTLRDGKGVACASAVADVAPAGVEDIVVRGFVNYTYTAGIAIGYGSAPPVRGLRFEDVDFVANHNKYAIWIQLTPAYFAGRGYAAGARSGRGANLDDFRFVNCTFENDGGHIYIDGGEQSVKNFAFENCTFYAKPTRPSMLMGQNVSPVLFKNTKFNDTVIKNAEELQRMNFDLLVPVKVEP